MLVTVAAICGIATPPSFGGAAKAIKDIVYAHVDGEDLTLDLYLPAAADSPPLVVWLHGGGWRNGDKASVPSQFVDNGFATASVNFRSTTTAPFPANVHDIKAAIRFLRAKAPAYGYRSDRIALIGVSSGAHLAALVGLTNEDPELEGTIGEHGGVSSAVQAVISYYGASDLMTILAQSTPFGLKIRKPALQLLLGGLPDEVEDLAKLASPVFHIDPRDPPLLLLHGDQDPQMPINQSLELQGAYEAQGLDVALDVVHGAKHGGDLFYAPEHLKAALDFLRRTIAN